jgi:hypothetical protein
MNQAVVTARATPTKPSGLAFLHFRELEHAFVEADLVRARAAFAALLADLPRLASAMARQAGTGGAVGLMGVAGALEAGDLERAKQAYNSLTTSI